jgi:CheY-like chemotaxis protein
MSLNYNNLDLRGKNIVIVEDDIPSIRYYETLLKNSGATVRVFQNGQDFVDYISDKNEKVDIVFMDYLIPIINGIECIRIFRKTRKNIPVLMLTAYYSEQSKHEAYIAGCTDYVLKPIYPEKFFFLLEKFLITETAYFRNGLT